MADFSIRYDNFGGGDYGRLDPARADKDQFSAINMRVYRSGLIGPRSGWKLMDVTGLPTHPTANGPMGFDVYNDKLLITLGRNYDFPMVQGAAATAYATYPASATQPVDFVRGNNVLYSLVNGQLYKHQAYGTAPITTPAPLSIITRWGVWMVGVDRNVPWRLWFSQVDAAGPNFDVWPAANYLDVGNTDAITTLNAIYNTLFVGKASGWWAVTGVLGVQSSVREVVIGNGPIDYRLSSVTTDNRIIYWPVEHVPGWFNGERVYLDDRQALDARALPFTGHAVIVTPTARSLILCSDTIEPGTDMKVWRESAWVRHHTPFDIGAITPSDVKAAAQMPEGVIFGVVRPTVIGDPTRVLSWKHDMDRPGRASDTWASAIDYGDNDLVPGTLTLPAWYDGQGRQVMVRSVVVQFRKWPSGVPNTLNQMRCEVLALGPYGAGMGLGLSEYWAEPAEIADAEGTPDSWRVNFGDQGYGNGFQITFPNIRGVAIQEVVAVVDLGKARV